MSLRSDDPNVSLVVNPNAGRGRARRLLPRVCAQLLAGRPGVNLRVLQAADYVDARRLCHVAVEAARPGIEGRSADALLVMGGDGMAQLGLNACARTDVPLGIVPAGSGNDFCRGVGIPTEVRAAVRAIVGGRTRRIDLMSARGELSGGVRQRYVGSIVSTGFDARVNRRANHVGLPIGGLAYIWATLAELSVFEPLPYRLLIDQVPRNQTAMLVAVGNAGIFGGGMKGCPNADVTDGLLDLTIIHPVSRMTLLRLLPAMFTGDYVRDPAVELRRAREVVVDGDGLFGMADGEYLGRVPLELEAVPAALSVFVD